MYFAVQEIFIYSFQSKNIFLVNIFMREFLVTLFSIFYCGWGALCMNFTRVTKITNLLYSNLSLYKIIKYFMNGKFMLKYVYNCETFLIIFLFFCRIKGFGMYLFIFHKFRNYVFEIVSFIF